MPTAVHPQSTKIARLGAYELQIIIRLTGKGTVGLLASQQNRHKDGREVNASTRQPLKSDTGAPSSKRITSISGFPETLIDCQSRILIGNSVRGNKLINSIHAIVTRENVTMTFNKNSVVCVVFITVRYRST